MAGVKGRSGGHNRKPIEQLKLEGTYRDNRHKGILVPEEKRERIVPQEHLLNGNPKLDREEIFNYFADHLHENGMTQKIDSILISQLVEAYCVYVNAISFARTDPEAAYNGRKLASSVAFEAAKEIRMLMSEFRMTPSTRGMDEAKKNEVKQDPVAAFLEAKVVNE